MNRYLVTIVLATQRITCDVIATDQARAMCSFIKQIGQPKSHVRLITCKVIA